MTEYEITDEEDYNDRAIDDRHFDNASANVFKYGEENDYTIVKFVEFVYTIYVEENEDGTQGDFDENNGTLPDDHEMKNGLGIVMVYLERDEEAIGFACPEHTDGGCKCYTTVLSKLCEILHGYLFSERRQISKKDASRLLGICVKRLGYLKITGDEDSYFELNIMLLLAGLISFHTMEDSHVDRKDYIKTIQFLYGYLRIKIKDGGNSMIWRTLCAIRIACQSFPRIYGYRQQDSFPKNPLILEQISTLLSHSDKTVRCYAAKAFSSILCTNGHFDEMPIRPLYDSISAFFGKYDDNYDLYHILMPIVRRLHLSPHRHRTTLLSDHPNRIYDNVYHLILCIETEGHEFYDTLDSCLSVLVDILNTNSRGLMIVREYVPSENTCLSLMHQIRAKNTPKRDAIGVHLDTIMLRYYDHYSTQYCDNQRMMEFVKKVAEHENFDAFEFFSQRAPRVLVYNAQSTASLIKLWYDDFIVKPAEEERKAKRQKVIDVDDDDDDDDDADNDDKRVDPNTCCVCYEKNKETGFLPCAHLVCCNGCANLVVKCPMCRSEISKRIKFKFC